MTRTLYAVAALLALVILFAPSRAAADEIEMRDGRVFTGKIVRDDGRFVYIDTVISGFRRKIPLRKEDIVRQEVKDLPENWFEDEIARTRREPPKDPNAEKEPDEGDEDKKPDKPDKTDTEDDENDSDTQEDDEEKGEADRMNDWIYEGIKAEDEEPKEPEGSYYLEVPLRGGFGEDIWPAGFKRSLEYAAEREHIKDIVLVLDSPGGYVWTADEIVDLMEQYEDRFLFHCVIDDAISASIWVVFASDTIFMTDRATIGGATVYFRDSFGDAQVDAKVLSITAAKLESIADSKGHPSKFVEPMVIMDASIAVWRDEKGHIHYGQSCPKNIDPRDVILDDTGRKVMTLTRRQAVDVGLATYLRGGVTSVGRALGRKEWKPYNDAGIHIMEQTTKLASEARRTRQRWIDRYQELVNAVNQRIHDAVAQDPRTTVQLYHNHRGQLTANSIRQWRAACLASIKAWQAVQEGLEELKEVLAELRQRGIRPPVSDFNLDEIIGQAEREIEWMKRNQNRKRL